MPNRTQPHDAEHPWAGLSSALRIGDPPMTASRPLALVTGASAGIGYELARICA